MDFKVLLNERHAQKSTLHDTQSMSRPGINYPAERLIQNKQFRVRVQIRAKFYSSQHFQNQFLLLTY